MYLSDKLDILDERLDSMENILVLQKANLEEHMKRTALLENEVGPLNKFMYASYGIISFVGFMGIVVAIYAAVR